MCFHDPKLFDSPDADTLSSQDRRGTNEILTKVLTQISLFGTCILALEKCTIVGAMISIPTVLSITLIPTIPSFSQKGISWHLPYSADHAGHQAFEPLHSDPVTDDVLMASPICLLSKSHNPTLWDIQTGCNKMNEKWYDAMDVKLADFQAKDTMIEILRSEVL
jgi:hypothetical protein